MGGVFVAFVRNCERYRVLGQWFGTVRVDEDDIRAAFIRHGFRESEIGTVVAPAPDWADDGFDTICLAYAARG
jgi:hypothetical protein